MDITEACSECGITIKVEEHESLAGATFLRGWWVRSTSGKTYCWSNLPSLSLKVGKIMKDPVTIAKAGDDSHELVFKALMDGLSGIPGDYPILGAMRVIAELLVVGDRGPALTTALNDPYIIENARYKPLSKVRSNGETPSRAHALELIEKRYGLSAVDIAQAEAVLSRVRKLPVFVTHPVFDILRDVDYPV